MFGAVSAGILMDVASKSGAYIQLPLFETYPIFELKEEHVTDVFSGYKILLDEYGNENTGVVSHCDHPAFTALRNLLDSKGYIKAERRWSNGDVVLKEFMINNTMFYKGDQFVCASAMKYHLFPKSDK